MLLFYSPAWLTVWLDKELKVGNHFPSEFLRQFCLLAFSPAVEKVCCHHRSSSLWTDSPLWKQMQSSLYLQTVMKFHNYVGGRGVCVCVFLPHSLCWALIGLCNLETHIFQFWKMSCHFFPWPFSFPLMSLFSLTETPTNRMSALPNEFSDFLIFSSLSSVLQKTDSVLSSKLFPGCFYLALRFFNFQDDSTSH